jgi:predicted AAA+ superfamily ATPase
MYNRKLLHIIENELPKQKVTLLLGARRVGKTELLQTIYKKIGSKCLWLNGEDANVNQLLEDRTIANYKRILQGINLLIIDEAQFIADMGRKAKLMIDEIKPLHIILTGSSAFDVAKLGEPLVGRTITHNLFSLAQIEIQDQENILQTKQHLEERLIYGSYPEVVTADTLQQKKQYLLELINTYLLKDILAFENIRNPEKLKQLLQLLAYQIGSEVSLDELGRNLGLSKNTVERYLDLLSKVFIIYKRGGFSRNLRKEIVKSHRWYFNDVGVRNAIINNFSPLALRQDIGQLWENYILAERIKYNSYLQNTVNSFFWRTYDQQEIDLIEEKDGGIAAFEMKWKETKTKTPTAFAKAYTESSFMIINSNNYLDWIAPNF